MGCARRHPLRLGQTVHVAPRPAPCRFHSPFILKELAGFAFCPASVRFFHRHLLSTSSPLRFQVRFVPFWNADPLFSITSPVRFCKINIFCPIFPGLTLEQPPSEYIQREFCAWLIWLSPS